MEQQGKLEKPNKAAKPAAARSPEAKLRLELVAVGHGDALILHWQPLRGITSTILIDGGPKAGGAAIADTLRNLGATKIDLAVLTHCDADHVDGLVDYTSGANRLPIGLYWGPCIPAFRRHDWLFPERITRGLDVSERLEGLITKEAPIVYPVEGAQWTSPDGDLVVRVLSPAGRLIERLLVGTDSDDLFLRYPTPLGWLLDAAPPLDPEDGFLELRAALSSGEISPALIPVLPAARRTIGAGETGEVARQGGTDPEFFGNNVLNDTSIVLLIEARLGTVRRRLLFTGDLENFTYLMAMHPMGLGCDVVKAPHHGSRSYIESNRANYDETWQWLRPKAALVSANGKHRLPRLEFRDAVLRHGTTLFCTCRRSREILAGPRNEESCHAQYNCGSLPQGSVGLTMTERTTESDAIACAIGGASGVTPILQMVQHTIEPSNLLDRFTEAELRNHANWAVGELRSTHTNRRLAGGEAGLSAISTKELARAANTVRRYTAAANIDSVLERASRQGKVWVAPFSRHYDDRKCWVMPSATEWSELENWIEGYAVIQLAVPKRKVGLVSRELLLAADTGFLAKRAAARFAFPEEMFDHAIWPRLTDRLLDRCTIATREFTDSRITAVVVLNARDLHAAYSLLVERLPSASIHSFMQMGSDYYAPAPYEGAWPKEMQDLIAPFWKDSDRQIPNEVLAVIKGRGDREEWDDPGGIKAYASAESCKNFRLSRDYSRSELTEKAACEMFAASLIARLNVLSVPKYVKQSAGNSSATP